MIRASLRRPVAVTMAYTAIALLGVAAWRNIPLEMLPDTELPQLSIAATWPGASPETVEAFLTAPLEATVQQVKWVETIESTSTEGRAAIDVEFARDADMDFARLDLSERIAALEESLPPGVGQVNVEPYVPEEFAEQNRPFLEYTFTGPYTLEALRAHLEGVVVPELMQVEGVAVVRVSGGRDRLLEIELDEEQIAALGLTSFEVRRAIGELDLVQEAGAIREGSGQSTITIVNRPASAEDVRTAVVTAVAGSPVRLGDIADVHDSYEDAVQLSRIDRRPAVRMYLVREIGANTVRVADAVKARVSEVEALNPYGSRFILEWDQSEDIREQLTDLRTRALFSALVIFVVLVAFLRSFRSGALVFATIAFSVLIAVNLIYFGGLTLNLLTLMGLAMGFGLIVDNSIVVLENVYRRWQAGEGAPESAERGAREVALPILASTATTLIVFVPFVYLQGELRVFYVPLAIVVALTLLASLLVAFTFIPSLSARVLRRRGRAADAAGGPRRPLYVRFYSDVVSFNLRHPWLAMLVTVGVFGGSYYVFDRYVTTWARWGGGWGSGDSYIDIRITLPRGSNLERTDQLVQYFEDRLSVMPEPEQFTSTVQPTFGRIIVNFPDSLESTAVPVIIKDQMVAFSHSFTGADVRVYGFGPSFYGGGGGAPNYGIQVLGYNYLQVRDIAEDIGRRLRRLSRIVDVDTNSSSRGFFNRDRASEFVVRVDRDRLARHGLTVEELVNGMRAVIGGASVGDRIKLGGEEVDFDVKIEEHLDMDVVALRETLVSTPAGRRIRLGDVVGIESREVLSSIRRENQQYERTVAYEFRGPVRLGDLVHEAVIEAVDVPPGYTVQEGRSRFFIDQAERDQIWFVLAIALLLIYMVTAALFESLLQPLCVILTVPMALIGVYLIFFYTNAAFTREAYVGVIMMFGIVVNNAILLVDHVNRIRKAEPAKGLDGAVLQGTLERVRPILMTTVTTVLGLLPLVLFGDGAGSNIWDALALVLIGGLLSSTIFVLTITPAVYLVLERARVRVRRRTALAPARATLALLVGVASALGGTAASADAQDLPTFSARDSAGVAIVESRAPALPAGSWSVSPEPDVVVGADETDPNQTLFGVAGAVALSDGRIVVAQRAEPIVRWFGPDGRFLAGSGRFGEGPGEFNPTLSFLWPIEADSAATWEHSPRRMHVFGPDAEYARSVVLDLPPDLPPGAYPQISGGSAAGFVGLVASQPEPGPIGEQTRDMVPYVAFRPDGSYRGRVATLPGFERFTIEIDIPGLGRRPTAGRPPFARSGMAWLHEDRLYYGSGDQFEVAVYGLDGSLARIVRADVPPRPVTRAMRRAYVERLQVQQAGAAQPTVRPAPEDRPFPEHLPAHWFIRTDREGWLWVRHYRLPEDAATRWSVFDPSGRWVSDVYLPPDWRVQDIGADYILAVVEDAFDVERVMKFRLRGRE